MLLRFTVFGSVPRYLAAFGVLWAANSVYLLVGFGGGMTAVSGLSLLLPLQDAVVTFALVNLPVEVTAAYRARRHVQVRTVWRLGAGIVVGAPLGVLALRLIEPHISLALFGAVVAGIGALLLWLPDTKRRWPPWCAPVVGGVSGVLGGFFGAGGPPLVLYFRLAGAAKETFRAALVTLFSATSALRLVGFAATGLVTARRAASALLLLPAAATGFLVGNALFRRLSQARYERVVALGLIGLGLWIGLRQCLVR